MTSSLRRYNNHNNDNNMGKFVNIELLRLLFRLRESKKRAGKGITSDKCQNEATLISAQCLAKATHTLHKNTSSRIMLTTLMKAYEPTHNGLMEHYSHLRVTMMDYA